MFSAMISHSLLSEEQGSSSISSGSRVLHHQDSSGTLNSMLTTTTPKIKKKRNLPGNPDPDAEVIALSPRTLMATNRFVCEICNKGFQRDQNLQLHRRGHNLPWKLKQRSSKEIKKRAYVCPEATCLHHHPSRALGDLTGIKKHYCRKHGEKKWKCEKCSKIYAVQSDWKAHSKTCGTREYRCDCGTLFSRKDSFITHRAFCDALAEESARLSAATNSILGPNPNHNNNISTTTAAAQHFHFEPQNRLSPPPPPLPFSYHRHIRNPWGPPPQNPNPNSHAQQSQLLAHIKHEDETLHNIIPLSSPLPYHDPTLMTSSPFSNDNLHVTSGPLSATALLQKAATMGGTMGHVGSTMAHLDMHAASSTWAAQRSTDGFTRDFLGLTGDQCNGDGDGINGGGGDGGNGNMRELFSFTGGVTKFPTYDHDRNSMLKPRGFEFTETYSGWGNC